MSRATEDQLDVLHNMLSDAWKVRLTEAKQDPDKPLTAAEATSLAKFLADNGVKGSAQSPRIAPIQEGLEALDDRAGITHLSKYRTST